MKHLLISAAAVALLAGCGNNTSNGDLEKAGEKAVESAESALKDLGKITLRKGDASQATAALTAMSLNDSGSGRITFDSKSVDGDGATYENVVLAVADEDDSGATIKVGRMELDGLDMTETGASFAKISLSDIELIPDDPEDAQEGQLKVASIELLNPSPQLAAWVATLTGDGAPGQFPEGADLSFDRFAMGGLDFALDDGDSVVDMALSSIEIGGVKDEGVAVASLQGLTLSGSDDEKPFSAQIGSISLQGADLSFIDAIRENAGDEEEMVAAILSSAYANPMDPGFDAFVLDNLAFEGDGVKFALPGLSSSIERNAEGQPVKYITPPYKVTLSADAAGGDSGSELASALGMVGYETVELTGAAVSSYDPDKDMLSFGSGENYMKLKDGFEFRMGGKIEGYSAYAASFAKMDFEDMMNGGEPDPEMMQQAFSQLKVHGFDLQLTDDSLVDRLFNLAAAQSGEDPAQLRSQAVAMTAMGPMMASQMGIDMNIVTDATTAVAEFLQEPGTLSIKLAPSQPLTMDTFMAMEDPSAITKEFLGLEITHAK